VDAALKKCDRVIVVLGSSYSAPSIKNPWTWEDRARMISASLTLEQNQRVEYVPVRDHFNSDITWVAEVQGAVQNIVNRFHDPDDIKTRALPKDICLFGADRDESTYYLNMFPQWTYEEIHVKLKVSATQVRDEYFAWGTNAKVASLVPEPVANFLLEFSKTQSYLDLGAEDLYNKNYKASWANTPYPVTFTTVDAVVIRSGHVLVVQRKLNPGKGLYAIPGGFLGQFEFPEEAAIRELKEETKIRVTKQELDAGLKAVKNFAHPFRSLRGRTITIGHFFDLGYGQLPYVKGSDDAEKAFWMPLSDLGRNEDKFFEDHYHIINYFVNRKV
jgi:bifunctional NMN adenylyltransferase/nudix hydrolase